MNVQKLSTVEVRERLSEVVNEAAFGNKTTIIERHGKGLAAIVPIAVLFQIQPGVAQSWPVPTVTDNVVNMATVNASEEDKEREKGSKLETAG
jgi:antitoxin (DNA-binding transcriptional repressor) of toxin-antitoxin stability system